MAMDIFEHKGFFIHFQLLLQVKRLESDHWVKGYEYFWTLDANVAAVVIPFSWG